MWKFTAALSAAFLVACGGGGAGDGAGALPGVNVGAARAAGASAQDDATASGVAADPGTALASGTNAVATSTSATLAAAGPMTSAPSSLATGGTPGGAPGVIEAMTRTAVMASDVGSLRAHRRAGKRAALEVMLDPLQTQTRNALRARSTGTGIEIGQPTQIGIVRKLPQTANADVVQAGLVWEQSAAGGRVAALHFKSSQALGVRLGVLVEQLPLGGVLRFYAGDESQGVETSASEVLATIQHNLDAGASGDSAHTWWSPDLRGDEITMELEMPPGAAADSFRVSVPRLSHVYDEPGEPSASARQANVKDDLVMPTKVASCNLDVTCKPEYNQDSKSVARMQFVKEDGNSYACTGTLLNDSVGSGTPYFLSANHCIGKQIEASTLTTLWFYRSASCNSTLGDNARTYVSGGATLLYASAATDTSFMRLNAMPPPGAVYAGSKAGAVDLGADLLALHHPQGGLQKYSLGNAKGYVTCQIGGETFSCQNSTVGSSTFLMVGWRAGVTEAGSSGSGLFESSNGGRYLVGQLTGGSSSCDSPAGTDMYGRFDVAYNQALSQWLNPGSQTAAAPGASGAGGGDALRIPIYRFFNTRTGTHFYTASSDERDHVLSAYKEYVYEGAVFYAYSSSVNGASPVYRFYNTRTGAHFYTVGPEERASVLQNYPWYLDEGVSWYADRAPVQGSTPIYRFYNTDTSTHFYTISAAERDMVVSRYPQFSFEGPVYEAWTSP